jgi:hypothetical protein
MSEIMQREHFHHMEEVMGPIWPQIKGSAFAPSMTNVRNCSVAGAPSVIVNFDMEGDGHKIINIALTAEGAAQVGYALVQIAKRLGVETWMRLRNT